MLVYPSHASIPQLECIPKEQLKTHLRFYNATRKENTAPHWSRNTMITTLHSFYCRSSGMIPLNVDELDSFWKTGNIATRNLHRLQPQNFVPGTQCKDNRCAMCTLPFSKDEMLYQLPCGDRFHVTHDPIYNTDNLKTLLRNDNKCPCCFVRVILPDTNRWHSALCLYVLSFLARSFLHQQKHINTQLASCFCGLLFVLKKKQQTFAILEFFF